MQSFRSDLALLGLAVVGVLAVLACTLTGHPVPDLFSQVVIAGLAGGASLSLPATGNTPAPTAPAAPAAAASAAVPAAVPVAQVAQVAQPLVGQ